MIMSRCIKRELQQGSVVTGMMVTELRSALIGQVIAASGADFFILDMEHSSYSFEDVSSIIGSCRNANIAAFVRIPEIRREYFTKVLDAGAAGILVPHIEEAREIAMCLDFGRYAPAGSRGLSLVRPHSGFIRPDRVSFTRMANETIMLMAQIETAKGVDNIDEIMQVPGLDLVFIGPSDLEHSLSPEENSSADRLTEAISTIVSAGARHYVKIGIHTTNLDLACSLIRRGVQFFSLTTDVGAIIEACGNRIRACRKEVESFGLEVPL